MKAKQFFVTTLAVILTGMFTAANCKGPSAKSDYETVDGDPLKTRIYTLDNGLKVYMSVNKEAPRIQTYIAVRVGGKNDPAETTGLAHYFEHLMFKGTTHFGTSNYEAEKPLLDEIERLFEVYRKTTDEVERKALYRQIDSISNKASQYAIPNEYDKLMAAIGATGTNAYTNFDVTCYTEDIPSNQIENWAKIQADRFQNSVIRGFHTELEAVYEEYNMGLASDARTVIDTLRSMLFFNHPYGTQSVIGTQQHLKNPSITNIKRYYETWYVPNNMAICLSGDFDPDEMIAIIKKYFGNMKPNDSLPKPTFKEEAPITSPTTKEVQRLPSWIMHVLIMLHNLLTTALNLLHRVLVSMTTMLLSGLTNFSLVRRGLRMMLNSCVCWLISMRAILSIVMAYSKRELSMTLLLLRKTSVTTL